MAKTNYEIKHIDGHSVLFSGEYESLKECAENAVRIGANLRGALLRGADLRGAIEWDQIVKKTRIIPDGDLVGWKKCKDGVIVKLLIPGNVRRSSAFGRKCRAESAKVLGVFGSNIGVSIRDGETIYEIGEVVYVNNFDPDFKNECAPGIHFFLAREEAENY